MGIYDREYLRDSSGRSSPFASGLGGWSASKTLAVILGIVWVYELIAGAMPEAARLVLMRGPEAFLFDSGLLTYGLIHFGGFSFLAVLFALLKLGPVYEEEKGPWRTIGLFLLGQLFAGLVWGALPGGEGGFLYGGFGGACALVLGAVLVDGERRLFDSVGWLTCKVGGAFVCVASAIVHIDGHPGLACVAVPLAGNAAAGAFWVVERALQREGPRSAAPARRSEAPQVEAPRRTESLRVQAEKADAVLAKIHEQGRDSLDAEEEKILEEYSQRLREKSES